MYKKEIISFPRAGLLVLTLLCIAKIHKKKLKKELQDQSALWNSEKNIRGGNSDCGL